MRCIAFAALLAATAAPFAAAPAFAQEGAPFTGFRLEGLVGWDRAQSDFDRADGVAYGIGAGYDMQLGGAVVGLEGEVMDSNTDKCTTGALVAGDRACTSAGRDLYIGARAGTVVGGRALLYAKAGYTNARVRTTYDDGTTAGTGDFRARENLDGFRVGAGAEYAVASNAFVKAEYRYSNYEQGFDRHQVLGGFGVRF